MLTPFLVDSWDWWFGQFKFDKWVKSARNLWIWNDMNEVCLIVVGSHSMGLIDATIAGNL